MVKQDSGSLYQHEKCRCRLKKTLDGHLSKVTKQGDVYSPWTSANTPPWPRGLHLWVRWRAPTEETSHIRGPKSSAGLLECLQQHDVDMPSGGTMVLEATMICIGNLEWPPHCFSSDKPQPWIRLLQQCSPERRCALAGQTKAAAVSTRATPSKG